MTWRDVLSHWDSLNRDLWDAGVDTNDRQVMDQRSWWWLCDRILGLLDKPPLGYIEVTVDEKRTRNEPLWATRIQTELFQQA